MKYQNIMKRWLFRIVLIFSLLETLLIAGNFSRRLLKSVDLRSIFSLINGFVLIFLVLVILGFTSLLILDIRGSSLFQKLVSILEDRRWFWGLLIFFSLILIECFQDLLFLRANLPEGYYPITFLENIPLLIWAGVVSFQSILLLIILRKKPSDTKPFLGTVRYWFIPVLLLILFVIMIVGFGSGFIPRAWRISSVVGIFETTNAPLPMLHIIIISGVVTGSWIGLHYLKKNWLWVKAILQNELIIFVLLWAVAVLVWVNVPLDNNYYIDSPRPPNFTYSVSSDAIYYETQAQQFLIGEGFSDVVQHPLYNYLLSFLHLIGGEHYLDIYRLQLAILAFTPFILYKLVYKLNNQFSGLLASAFFILRERNALLLGDSISLSNGFLLLTEPIALMGVILFVYLLTTWLQAPDRKGMPFLIGGLIGFLALIRAELLSLIFVFFISATFLYFRKWIQWLRAIVIMTIAVSIITIPWMTRNYQKSGSFFLDKGRLVRRTAQTYINYFIKDDPDQETVQSQDSDASPDFTMSKAEVLARHMSNSVIQTVLYLPSNHQPLGGLDNFIKIVPEKRRVLFFQDGLFSDNYLTSYVKSLPYWWYEWDGYLISRSILPMIFVGVMIWLGFRKSWEKTRWICLIPTMVWGFHIITYVLFSRSGGRYIQVVDWVSLLYFSIGLTWVIFKGIGMILKKTNLEEKFPSQLETGKSPIINRTKSILEILPWLGGLLLILVGLSMPLAEIIIPQRYTFETLETRLNELEAASVSNDPIAFDENLDLIRKSKDASIYGKALYPGFYTENEIMEDDRRGLAPPAGQSRLVFYIVGTRSIWVSIPMDEPPDYFPHGAEVVVLGNITRDSEADLQEGLRPYFLASKAFIMNDGSIADPVLLRIDCSADHCLE